MAEAQILDAKASDGLANAVSGAGTSSDKRFYDRYMLDCPLSPVEVEAAYRTSGLCRKVHDLPPFDMTRAWRIWQAEDGQIAKLEAEERRLGLRAKVRKALTWDRLYGGSALILGGSGNASEPLDLAKIGKGGLRYVHCVTRHQLTYEEIESDLESEWFGQPKAWKLSSGTGASTTDIHPSRVIAFVSRPNPEGATSLPFRDSLTVAAVSDPFWGDPLLQCIQNELKNADLTQGGIASLVHEAKVDTIKIPGLTELVSTDEGEKRLMKRLNVANLAKSILNARIIDGEEEWDTRQITFASLPDVLDRFLNIVAAVSYVPVTKMLGTSAKGMNATGSGDADDYDETISAWQENDLRPCLERVDELLIRSALGSRPDEVYFEFAPLTKLSAKEQADIEKTFSDTVTAINNSALVPTEAFAKAVQNRMIESGQWPGLDAALKDAEEKGQKPDALSQEMSADLALNGDLPADQVGQPPAKKPQPAQDATPRSLYVSRKVINTAEIVAWAKDQGFKNIEAAEELHVTLAYSTAPVDWMKAGESWYGDQNGDITIKPGGPRLVERLGDKGAVVLLFSSTELQYRHRCIIDAGASWDWDDYQPHVTLTYDAGDMDLSKVEPYRGKIVLGPEIFEEITEGWSAVKAAA